MPTPTNPNNFDLLYNGPWKGIDSSMPENLIPKEATPSCQNFIMRNGELRTRPRQYLAIPGPQDNSPINTVATFMDSNNVIHTVMVTQSGLWQLNRNYAVNITPTTLNKIWSKVGTFPVQPGSNLPSAIQTFINSFYWTNGSNNLWSWDGIRSLNKLSSWFPKTKYYVGNQVQDNNGNWQVCIQPGTSQTPGPPAWSVTIGNNTTDNNVIWVNNGKPLVSNGGIQSVAMIDATNGITAGGLFLGELNAQLILLNVTEGNVNGLGVQNFPQRIRWCPSGIPNIWDPNVNIGAGFSDFLEVGDQITGVLFIGSTGLIIRTNGVTEISINASSGTTPFLFNHLWASEHGIGNIYIFSIAQYGPVGIFISTEDIYEYSIGGFKDIAGTAHTAIFDDLNAATSTPISTMFPMYNGNYVYLQYALFIPIGKNTKVWRYSVKDKTWQPDFYTNITFTAPPRFVAIN